MAPAQQWQNIFDLTARESAWLGLPQADLLIKAFKAIAMEQLPAHVDGSPSTAVRFARQAIPPLENNPHFFLRWFRSVMVDLTDYRHWRKMTLKEQGITTIQRPPHVSRKKVQEGIKRYLDDESAAGHKGSQKRAWEYAKTMMPGATYRQVIEALATAEGGEETTWKTPRIDRADEELKFHKIMFSGFLD